MLGAGRFCVCDFEILKVHFSLKKSTFCSILYVVELDTNSPEIYTRCRRYNGMMTCKDAEKLIPEFLDDDLDNQELSDFLSHIDSCPECKEELTIQFLVRVGMQRLEDGNTFNLSRELEHLLSDSKKRLHVRKYLVMTSYILEIAVAALLAICLLLAIAL